MKVLHHGHCNISFQVFERYLKFCGIGIQNAQLFEVSILEYKKNQVKKRHISLRQNSTNTCGILMFSAPAVSGQKSVSRTSEFGEVSGDHHQAGQRHAQVPKVHSLPFRPENVRSGEL